MKNNTLVIISLLTLFGATGCSTTPQTQLAQSCGAFSFDGYTNNPCHSHLPGDLPEALFQLDFRYDPSKCNSPCNCGKIWFVQVLRPRDVDTGEIIQPNCDQQNRMVKSNDPAMYGWAVDRSTPTDGSSVAKLGYYFLDAHTNLEVIDCPNRETFAFGSVNKMASMHDDIAEGYTACSKSWTNRNMLVQGIVIAVCMDEGSNCSAHVLGTMGWAFNFTKDGGVDPPQNHKAFVWEQDAVSAAVDAWNKQGGHDKLPQFIFGP